MLRCMICLLVVSWLAKGACSQSPALSPERLGYSAHALEHPELGTVNYYIRSPDPEANKPILLYLDGSGPYPLFQRMKQGFGSTLVIQDKRLLDRFDWVLISKPGVPFVDDMEFDTATGAPRYDPPEEYTKRLSLSWRVDSARAVIDELLGRHGRKPAALIVVGVSEGFQVAAKLASEEPRITAVGLFVGNGLNQFFDFIVAERMKMERGEQSPAETQRQIEAILQTAREIYADPDSVDKFWMGHTYKRWASFTRDDPLQSLKKIQAPVFVACCALDKNTSILSADYIPLEFARQQRSNLTYKVYPYEHSFMEAETDPNGNRVGIKPHFEEVFREFMAWLDSQGQR